MDKRKAFFLSVVAIFLMAVIAVGAAAQDVVYITEPVLNETPKIMPRMDAPLWDMDYRHNPALLKLDCPYEFIDDAYYLGSGWDISSESIGRGFTFFGAAPAFITNKVATKYLTTVLGTDAGVALKLNDRSDLAVIANYRYGNVRGDGNFFLVYANNIITPFVSRSNGSIDQKIESHDLSLSVLYSLKLSDALTLGAGLKETYRTEWLSDDLFAVGSDQAGNPNFRTDLDRDLRLRYNTISPVLGVSFNPAGHFSLDGWVSAGFYFGDVRKNATLFDNDPAGVPTYREDLDSGDVSGWEIAASVRPAIALSDALSVPFVLEYAYRDFTWSVGGSSTGEYAPFVGDLIFHGAGHIGYENDETTWHAKAGAGLTFDAGWAMLAGMLSYTRWDFRNAYDQENETTGIATGLTAFAQRDTESRDIASLDLSVKKKFSDMLSADFSACYLVGWAHRRYEMSYRSPWEILPASGAQLKVVADGRDAYQDLILSAGATLTPMDRLSLSLTGTVTIPLNDLDYTLEGLAGGFTPGQQVPTRNIKLSGPVVREYESSGWEWGALLSLTYEFGCPVATPPPAPPAPVIEPKIEPMSFK